MQKQDRNKRGWNWSEVFLLLIITFLIYRYSIHVVGGWCSLYGIIIVIEWEKMSYIENIVRHKTLLTLIEQEIDVFWTLLRKRRNENRSKNCNYSYIEMHFYLSLFLPFRNSMEKSRESVRKKDFTHVTFEVVEISIFLKWLTSISPGELHVLTLA